MTTETPRLDYATPHARRGMPIWAWVLIGVGGVAVLFVVLLSLIAFIHFRNSSRTTLMTAVVTTSPAAVTPSTEP